MGGNGDYRRLRILHIDPEKNWGGGEAQVLGLLGYLAARGHQNDLLGNPHGLLLTRCRTLDVRAQSMIMRNDADVRCVPALRRLIRERNYDIVHFHTKRAHALALWVPRSHPRPKYVVTRRMDYPEHPSWYTRFLYNRRVDGVVAISRAIGDQLANAGVHQEKIRCISSGIDPGIFSQVSGSHAGAADVFVVGCLASLEERKGHQYLLEAAALLKAQGLKIRYELAGEGPRRAQLEAEVTRLGLCEQVRFLGFINDTAKFFAEVDLLAMPSLYEGLGVAALEAMAAGRAVIATRVGGLTESVIDGATGLLVPPRDSAALARAIAKFAESRSLAQRMGSCGRERVRRYFSLETMAKQNESYYQELVGCSPD
ncbi:MAG TPA: glycosyltransferase family 4 protein [Candidatus Binatia bacterium]